MFTLRNQVKILEIESVGKPSEIPTKSLRIGNNNRCELVALVFRNQHPKT